MIIDDNVDYATALGAMVRGWGHEAKVVHSGYQALAVAPDFRPRVVLLDLGLPDMHGYTVAKRLRALASSRALYFVCVTGWNQIADQLTSAAAGISHHLVKPVNLEMLKEILGAYQAAEEIGAPTVHS